MHRHQIKPVRLIGENLRDLTHEILAASDLPSLLSRVAEFVQQILQSCSVVIYTKGRREKSFQASAIVGIPETLCDVLEFDANSRLLSMLERGVKPSIRDLPEPERSQLAKMGTTLLVPVLIKSELLGFLTLGRKLSGDEYDPQDHEFLATAAEHSAAGIERMSLQEWKLDAERALDIQRGLLQRKFHRSPATKFLALGSRRGRSAETTTMF